MKKKFILLPITLIAFAPTIVLVGCEKKPSPTEYESVEMIQFTPSGPVRTKFMTFEKGKNYKFYCNDWSEGEQNLVFHFMNYDHTQSNLNVDLHKFVKNDKILVEGVDYWEETDVYGWKLYFSIADSDNIEIYLKSKETKQNMYAILGV